ncbi:MAG: substrate-binding periplasmic protein [Geminicoccales bacterium]
MRPMVLSAILAASLSVTGFDRPVQADVVTLRADEWCPYNCVPGSDRPGYMIEIAQEVFGRAGHQVDYQVLNWMRSIAEARNGRHTAIVGAINEEAPDFVYPSEAIGMLSDGFVVRKGTKFHYTGQDSFDGLTIGIIRGYDYHDLIDAYIKKHSSDRTRVQFTTGDDALEQNLKKLAAGRIDVVIDDQNVLNLAIQEFGLSHLLEIAGNDGAPEPAHIAFSPADDKAAEYAMLLADGIKDLRASGRLAEILGRYGLVDWR